MEYYDEVVEIEDKSGNARSNNESDTIGRSIPDDLELKKPMVNKVNDSSISETFLHWKLFQEIPQHNRRPTSSINRNRQPQKIDSFGSESDSSSDTEQPDSKQFISDHKDWEKLDVSVEIKEIFQYILR